MSARVYSRRKTDPLLRFLPKVGIAASGCWEWLTYRTPDGYGQFWGGNACILAHRWSYQHYVGPIPDGLVIDHLCRNPGCVNPDHLEPVPMRTNTERGLLYETLAATAKKKTHCKRGHPLSGPNLFIDRRGDRCCKTCRAAKAEEWRRANRARVNLMQQIRRNNFNPNKEKDNDQK
jgi:hypothetical protein